MIVKQVKTVVRDCQPQFSGRLQLVYAPMLATALISFFITEPLAAASKKSVDWQHATTVEAQAASEAANPLCQQISSNISKRIASIRSLQAAIAKSAAGPPSSLKSAFEDMFGTRQPDAKTRELERNIKVERKAADDLNDMMRSSQCTPVDIDAALNQKKIEDHAAPEAPKAMPDDLVQAPHRYK